MTLTARYCRIEMLGTLQVILPDRVLTRFRTQKTALLLAFLAHQGHRAQTREALIEMLWPETDLSAGRDSLTTALTSLRRQLEPAGVVAGSVLEADRQQVRLNPAAFTTDVSEFETLLDSALSQSSDQSAAQQEMNLRRAVELYRGVFLAGHYDDWVALEQSRLAERYVAALLALSEVCAATGDLNAALTTARQALAADPYEERACRAVMRLQGRLGQLTSALETYRQLETLLREELNVAPGRATRELAEQLRQNPDAFLKPQVVTPIETEAVGDAATSLRATPERKVGSASTAPGVAEAISPPLLIAPSLPLQTTSFFGRLREREQITAWLRPSDDTGISKRRLVTLTGPGGVGKTRLAIEAAGALTDAFSGGVWFVSLAEVPHPRLLLFALASALHIQPAPDSDLLEQVVTRLHTAPTLLVLDNFEHLLLDSGESKSDDPRTADASELVRRLLEGARSLSLLITSRRALGLGGEQEFPLSPLAIPEQDGSPESLLDFASVALYQDRAQYVLPDFAITPRNADAVGQLCRQLEGMPLAIEMAAAWVKTLSPAQILERLGERLDLLVSRRRDLPARQRSLRATIEWSYDLLSPELQQMFAQLSVFRGGFDVETAARVCCLPVPVSLEGLALLQQHSLILREEREEDARYRLLETLREFGWEQLVAAGEQEAVRDRHSDCFLHIAEEAEPRLTGSEQTQWFLRLQDAHDNFRAALLWCQESEANVERGLRLGVALWKYWMVRGHFRDGREHLTTLLAKQSAQSRTLLRAQALNAAGVLAQNQGDYEEARRWHEESLAIKQQLGDRRGAAQSLNNLGGMAFEQGDYEAARALHEESLTIKREIGDLTGIGISLNNLGNAAHFQGDYTAARRFHEESLAIKQKLGDTRGIGQSLNNLGNIAMAEQDYPAALRLHQESLIRYQEVGDAWCISVALGAFARLANAMGQPERAARLWGAAQTVREQIGAVYSTREQEEHEQEIATARERVSASDWQRAWSEGRRMMQEQAVAFALEAK